MLVESPWEAGMWREMALALLLLTSGCAESPAEATERLRLAERQCWRTGWHPGSEEFGRCLGEARPTRKPQPAATALAELPASVDLNRLAEAIEAIMAVKTTHRYTPKPDWMR